MAIVCRECRNCDWFWEDKDFDKECLGEEQPCEKFMCLKGGCNNTPYKKERYSMSKITGILVHPVEPPVVVTFEHTLENLQKYVGGLIDIAYPWEDKAAIICNDNGIAEGLALNRVINDHTVIFGSFLILGLTRDDFCSLNKQQIDTYMEMFREPEWFFKKDGSVVCVKVKPDGSVGEPEVVKAFEV